MSGHRFSNRVSRQRRTTDTHGHRLGQDKAQAGFEGSQEARALDQEVAITSPPSNTEHTTQLTPSSSHSARHTTDTDQRESNETERREREARREERERRAEEEGGAQGGRRGGDGECVMDVGERHQREREGKRKRRRGRERERDRNDRRDRERRDRERERKDRDRKFVNLRTPKKTNANPSCVSPATRPVGSRHGVGAKIPWKRNARSAQWVRSLQNAACADAVG